MIMQYYEENCYICNRKLNCPINRALKEYYEIENKRMESVLQ